MQPAQPLAAQHADKRMGMAQAMPCLGQRTDYRRFFRLASPAHHSGQITPFSTPIVSPVDPERQEFRPL